jgi:hypothetical protein
VLVGVVHTEQRSYMVMLRRSSDLYFKSWLAHQAGALAKQALCVAVLGLGMFWTADDVMHGRLQTADFVAIGSYVVQVRSRHMPTRGIHAYTAAIVTVI